MTSRDAAKDYLAHFIGAPYRWGGDDPSGWDCSGLAIEWMQGVGILPRGFDTTADGLLRRFRESLVTGGSIQTMDLVFWLVSDRAVHVETVWDPVALSVGASGGGSRTNTEGDAWAQNAFVKMRPHGSRSGERVFVDPFGV